MAANTANGIVGKQSKGGFVVAKFTSGGFIKPNHVTSTIGANTAGETVQSMSIVSMQIPPVVPILATLKFAAAQIRYVRYQATIISIYQMGVCWILKVVIHKPILW